MILRYDFILQKYCTLLGILCIPHLYFALRNSGLYTYPKLLYSLLPIFIMPNRDVKIVFLKNRLSFAKNRFFSIIVSDVTVTVGCSNMLGCREGWCSCQGGWWRGRPTNRLDTQTEQTTCRMRSLGPSPVTGTFSQPQRVGEEGRQQCVVNSIVWNDIFSMAVGGGGEGRTRVLSANYLQSHRPPSRPTGQASRRPGGQATAHNAGRPTVKCRLRWGVSA